VRIGGRRRSLGVEGLKGGTLKVEGLKGGTLKVEG